MRRFFKILLPTFLYVASAWAGPHTIQRGETFADVARLYGVPLDSLLKANPDTEAYAGLTIEVPLSTLVYDLGGSDLFRNIRYRRMYDEKKGAKCYNSAHEKHKTLSRVTGEKLKKLEKQIIDGYKEAATYGNTDALYQLGRYKVHGILYPFDGYPTFSQSVNKDTTEFQEGIEYLQVAALAGANGKALAELAMACAYEDSPICNPYLCLGMLQQYQRENRIEGKELICEMYENGHGILPNLIQAYIYCPSTDLNDSYGNKTRREKILEQIEAMPANFESARYGVGLDAKTMMAIGLSYYHDDCLEPEGFFWLHRSARQNNADANWALACILQNKNFARETMAGAKNITFQMLRFVKSAAANGKQEAKDYLKAYEEQQKAREEAERLQERERQRQIEEKKQRRRQMWANVAGTVMQAAAQTFVAVESAKMQARQMQATSTYSPSGYSVGGMSDSQWQAKNQLALQQIAQYTVNKTYADWTGTPMVPTDMSAVDLGTDISPGSPLWCWGIQQQINTLSTQEARMSCESIAFYQRQADQITQQMMENPLQPIAGYVDRDGNWISHEMVANGYNSLTDEGASDTKGRNNGFEEIKEKNRSYFKERYGDRRCPSCNGLKECHTCDGHGYFYDNFGSNRPIECPNCYKINGRASGKCGRCQGRGTVYGLKI